MIVFRFYRRWWRWGAILALVGAYDTVSHYLRQGPYNAIFTGNHDVDSVIYIVINPLWGFIIGAPLGWMAMRLLRIFGRHV